MLLKAACSFVFLSLMTETSVKGHAFFARRLSAFSRQRQLAAPVPALSCRSCRR